MKKRFRRMILVTVIMCLLLAAVVYAADRHVESVSGSYLLNSPTQLEETMVVLVLGTAPLLKNGQANPYFSKRMEAVQELYKNGKVKHLILSGDNHHENYDEPEAMRQALLAIGIPDSLITLDYAGFRTLDSVIRTEAIFGQRHFLIVSQQFHNERAVFLARKHGFEARAYNAEDVSLSFGFKVMLREYLARVKACLDIYVLRTKPRFLGEKIQLPL